MDMRFRYVLLRFPKYLVRSFRTVHIFAAQLGTSTPLVLIADKFTITSLSFYFLYLLIGSSRLCTT